MKKLLRPSPQRYPHSRYSPWMVVVPKGFTGTERVRRFFKTEEEAQRYCDRLSPANYACIDPHSITRDEDPASRSLESCAREWMERFRQHKPMFFQARQVMRALIARFGRQPIQNVGIEELEKWLGSLALKYSPTTQHNYWRRVRAFFIHCHDFGWITNNPMKILKEPHYKKPDRPIMKPRHMGRFLEAAKGDRALMAWLCLGGFAGIRTCEVLAMDWDDLLWDTDEIRVRKAKEVDNADAKEIWMRLDEEDEEKDIEIAGDRVVTMEAALRRNLEPLALKGAAIDAVAQRRPDGGRGSRKIVPGGQRTLYCLIRDNLRSLGVKEWPKNCLRHAYKSYHIAFHRNLERTRFEMGHGHSNTTKYRYGSSQQKTPAEEWWAL